MRIPTLAALLLCLFTAHAVAAACVTSFLSPVHYNGAPDPGDVATGDFNNDGYADIAVLERFDSPKIHILLGTANGTFSEPTSFNFGTFSQAEIGVAELNGDGDLDLVVLNSGVTNNVIPFLGNGDGTFTAGQAQSVWQNPSHVAFGHFNAGGVLDMVVARSSPGGFDLFSGDGSGGFTKIDGPSIPVAPGEPATDAGAMAVGDFDGDGALDVALGDLYNGKAWVWFGNGNGTFVQMTNPLVTGPSPRAAAAADLNRDGRADLAVGDSSGALSVYLSNSDRTFGSAVDYLTPGTAYDLLARDLDGDGDLDLVYAGSGLAIFRSNGNGTLAAREDLSGSTHLGVATIDVDRDGGPDLAAGNFSTGKMSIFQNTCGQVSLSVSSSAPTVVAGNDVTITASLTANPAATGTLTLAQTGHGNLGQTTVNGTSAGVNATRSLTPGTYEFTATYSGDSRFAASTARMTQTVQRPPFGPPVQFRATSTGGPVSISWIGPMNVAYYEIWRSSGAGYGLLTTVNAPAETYTDNTAPASSALLYKIKAFTAEGSPSDFSTPDLTITHTFTDESITAQSTVVKRAHVTEARGAANQARALAGLPPFNFTDTTPIVVSAVHLNELRSAIDAARTAIGIGPGAYVETLTPGVTIVKRIHIIDVRNAMR